jgi:Transposase DDE domain group 1
MSRAFDAMDRDNGILIGTPERLVGILTPMDFLRYLYQVANPFVLVSEIELALTQQRLGKELVLRADAAFAKPELYEALEERDVKYAIRLPTNDNLERKITQLLTHPVGRPATSH